MYRLHTVCTATSIVDNDIACYIWFEDVSLSYMSSNMMRCVLQLVRPWC